MHIYFPGLWYCVWNSIIYRPVSIILAFYDCRLVDFFLESPSGMRIEMQNVIRIA